MGRDECVVSTMWGPPVIRCDKLFGIPMKTITYESYEYHKRSQTIVIEVINNLAQPACFGGPHIVRVGYVYT